MGPGRLFPLVLAGMLAAGGPAWAQNYPERSIKLVLPFVPGGITDAVGRLWAEKMKGLLGPIFVENQGGAGGAVGAAAVTRAQPDGYTILLGGTAALVLIPAAARQAPYDPAKDLEPISILGLTAMTIAIHPSVPAQNLQELIDFAKANPGKLSYGSGGAGSMAHLTGELFKSLTQTSHIVHVPYKGGGQSITDLISGHIPMVATSVTGQVLELHRSGKVRMLAVTTAARVIAAPDIPTAVEAGLPGMIAQNFFGLFAPAGTPKAIIEQIARATGRAMADEEFRQKLIASGFEPHLDSTPETTRRFVEGEISRLAPVIKAIGLKLE
jgi:tripartite-type tricarboxylate transporter receptor subunit TctC